MLYIIYEGYALSKVRIAIAKQIQCKHQKPDAYRLLACLERQTTKTAFLM